LPDGVAELDAAPAGAAELDDRLGVVEEEVIEDTGPIRNAESTTNCCL